MKVFVSLLVAVGCLLVAPAAASAVTYTVDSTADEVDALPGTGGCLTAGAKCTLRAAIEESNFSTVVDDTIKFAAAFNGEAADTIAPGSALPAITDKVHIDGDSGGQCATAAGVNGPCVGVNGSALVVENADGVEIEGLAVTGAATAINVIDSSQEFVARDDWLGVKLDGSAGGNTRGLFLDPDSNNAVIGGLNAADRNVIANNSNEGLDVEGADDATVIGNYFGVTPAGTAQAANAKDIEVTDSTAGAFKATGNEIGASIEGAALSTTACDGGCNAISGATSTGLDLQGNGGGQNEAPASGPTTVRGNLVGLNAAGTAVIANGTYDVLAGAADKATIGGPASGDTNFIAGGTYGVYAENADALLVRGNAVGFDASGAAATPPTALGMFIYCQLTVEPATVRGNAIRMTGGVAIEHRFLGAEIIGNFIEGGLNGIRTEGSTTSGGLIEGNLIEGAEEQAILIKNENNLLVGNLIEGAGKAAIRIEGIAGTGNTIGGDLESEENAIFESGGDAVEIVNEEDTDNQVRRNFGAANAGLFIDLGANGEGNNASTGPNAGIQAPAISAAKLTGASGSGALPGAEVRVFRKATTSPGEIESFLGEAKADGSGNWSVTYAAAIPGETQVAATQTGFEGTSELAFAKTEPAPKTEGEGSKEPKKEKQPTPKKPKSPKKPKAPKGIPQTTIVKGPRARTHARNVRFKFVSSLRGSKFECKLGHKRFKPCTSPKTYKKLKLGKHVFKVRAVKGKAVDPTPAKWRFKILK